MSDIVMHNETDCVLGLSSHCQARLNVFVYTSIFFNLGKNPTLIETRSTHK